MSTSCAHDQTQPVEVRDRRDGGTTVVAQVCVECLEALPPGWGCDDCEWVEQRRLCDTAPSLLLAAPCPAHR